MNEVLGNDSGYELSKVDESGDEKESDSMGKRIKVKFSELPKFPEVRRDLALLFDENVDFASVRRAAFRASKKLLKQVTLFDVYRGEKIPAGKKQYALGFVFQDLEKTLTDTEIEKATEKLLAVFQNEFGAVLR